MSIGYACLTVGVQKTDLRSCILKNASEAKLLEITEHNLNSLENMIDYNIKNNIMLFRISSDLIPFGSSYVNKIMWWDIYKSKFLRIGEKVQENKMRISMHPGQYTVLNSPNEDVVTRAIHDLNYHTKVLNSFGVNSEHKIVLHIGGIYNDKEEAIERFIKNYERLDDLVKERLVIENDDKSYNISDVIEISRKLNIPVVFDNLHNSVNPYDKEKSDLYWISKCRNTWTEKDGRQKIHYSQQNPLKKLGSHSESININEFMRFYIGIGRENLDIMLEVKDKNLSAIKCINSTSAQKEINYLEIEWSKYKYALLEKSPINFDRIKELLNEKSRYPVITFYNLIEDTIKQQATGNNSINAALCVWRFFEDIASDKEKSSFFYNIDKVKQGKATIKLVKNSLWKMALKYENSDLLESYYFVL